jgi:hypothetical protein
MACRKPDNSGRLKGSCSLGSIGFCASVALLLVLPGIAQGQNAAPDQMPPEAQAPTSSPAQTQATQPPAQAPGPAPAAPPSQNPAQPPPAPISPPSMSSPPIAIVPIDMSIPGSASAVAGPIQAWKGRAYVTSSAAITAGPSIAQVTLPYRGTLRVCPLTTVKLSADASVPANEIPGLMMGLDSGALEASFAITRNSDVVLTPNFRILIGGPGASEVKVRLGDGGDTCVDNSGANAPYVVVTSVFDAGLYRVQPGQRVMFEHGDLHTVVDNEKEPCGCPPPGEKVNEFPLAQSEGLAPPAALPPVTLTNQTPGGGSAATTLQYNAPGNTTPQPAAIPQPPAVPQTTAQPVGTVTANQAAQPQAGQKKPGFFGKIGRFFKKIFGAE